MSHNCRWRTYI